MLRRLDNAKHEAEVMSESMSLAFLEGTGPQRDIAEFTKAYRDLRKTYHIRQEKVDKAQQKRVAGLI